MSSEQGPPEAGLPCDLTALVELEKVAFDDPWPKTAIASELRAPEALVLVVRRSDGIAAWCCFRIVTTEAELLRLAVHHRYRRQGNGKRLLETGLREVHRRGAERVFLEVREDNSAALTLYDQLGFQQIGRRCLYYRDGTAAAILSLDL